MNSNNDFGLVIDKLTGAGVIAVPLQNKAPFIAGWQNKTAFTAADWRRADSIGVKMGPVNGGFLVCIDIDTKAIDVVGRVEKALKAAGIVLESCYNEESRNGFHFIIKAESAPDGYDRNTKLITGAGGVLVETRAAGGVIRVAPSEGNKKWNGPDIWELPTVAADAVRKALSNLDDRQAAPVAPVAAPAPFVAPIADDSPADNMRRNPRRVVAFLMRRGWEFVKESGGRAYMRRPDAPADGGNHSITIALDGDGGTVYVWSSKLNVEQERPFSPLSFIAAEYYNGDERKAAADWRREMMDNKPINVISAADYEEVLNYGATEETPAPADWRDGVADAVRYANQYPESVLETPDELYKGFHALETFIQYQAPNMEPAAISPAFAGSWAAFSFVAGRRVTARHIDWGGKLRQEGPTRYVLLVAPTGAGKNTPFEFVKDIATEYTDREHDRALSLYRATVSGMIDNGDEKGAKKIDKPRRRPFLISQPASVQSFCDRLQSNGGRALVAIDEAGDFISAVAGFGVPVYSSDFIKFIKEAFTSEYSRVIVEYSRAARKKGGPLFGEIIRPACPMFLCGTPDNFYTYREKLSKDGTFGRFDIFTAGRKKAETAPIDDEIERLYNMMKSGAVELPAALSSPVRRVVESFTYKEDETVIEYTPAAYRVLMETQKEIETAARDMVSIDADFSAVLNQYPRRLFKAAVLYAAARVETAAEIDRLTITETDATAARLFMLWQVVQYSAVFCVSAAPSDTPEYTEFRRYIESISDEKGRFMKYWVRTRRPAGGVSCRLSIQRIQALIDAYERAGEIERIDAPDIMNRRGGPVYRFVD